MKTYCECRGNTENLNPISKNNLKRTQTKQMQYGLIKVVNFTIIFLRDF